MSESQTPEGAMVMVPREDRLRMALLGLLDAVEQHDMEDGADQCDGISLTAIMEARDALAATQQSPISGDGAEPVAWRYRYPTDEAWQLTQDHDQAFKNTGEVEPLGVIPFGAASGAGAAIGRNITFSPHDDETGNAVISPDYPDGPYWTLIGQGGDDRQNAVAAEICRRLNAAPPVPSVSDQGSSLRDTQPGAEGPVLVGTLTAIDKLAQTITEEWENGAYVRRLAREIRSFVSEARPSISGVGT